MTLKIGSCYGVQRGGGGQFLTLTMITLMTRNQCLTGLMVLSDVELLYISPPLRRGERREMVQRLNTCFKASARSPEKRRRMCVQIVRTQMRSKIKCGSATLRQTAPVLHIVCVSHMNFSDKYIRIKSRFYIFMPSMQHYC